MNPTQEFWKLKDFAVQNKTAKNIICSLNILFIEND